MPAVGHYFSHESSYLQVREELETRGLALFPADPGSAGTGGKDCRSSTSTVTQH